MPDYSKRLQPRSARSPRDNNDYMLSKYMRREIAVPDFRDWGFPQAPLDQGDTPHCGGFSVADKRVCPGSLVPYIPQINQDGHDYYYGICEVGGYPNTENGVFTRDAAKYGVKRGFWQAYAFADSLAIAEEFVLTQDTLLFATAWYDSMFNPNTQGLVDVSGNVAGYHLWVIRGRDRVNKLWVGHNSWGNWGKGGKFYVSDDGMAKLYENAGEILAAVEKPSIDPTPVPPNPGCLPVLAGFLHQAALDPKVKENQRVARALELAAKDLRKTR